MQPYMMGQIITVAVSLILVLYNRNSSLYTRSLHQLTRVKVHDTSFCGYCNKFWQIRLDHKLSAAASSELRL